MERAAPQSGAPAVMFRDGLGERRHVVDPMGHEALDVLCLKGEFSSAPSFESALRERVGHLAGFRHATFGRVRAVERLGARDMTLAIVSDATPGIRLSDLLAEAEARHLPVDINTALGLIRQLVSAVAALHEHGGEAAHGALGPERLIVTSDAKLVVVEYVVGMALEQLRHSREQFWTDLRVPLPRTAGSSHFDQRADVTQIGAVALALILGRLLKDDEYPAHVADLVASTWAVSTRGGFEPLPPGLRAWLGRALQLDPRNTFASAVEARVEIETVIAAGGFPASSASIVEFLARCRGEGKGPTLVNAPDTRTPLPVEAVARAPIRSLPEPLMPGPVAAPPALMRPAPPVPVSAPPASADPPVRSMPMPDVPVSPSFGSTEVSFKQLPAPEPRDDEAGEDEPLNPVRGGGRRSMLVAVAAVAIVATGGFAAWRYLAGAPAPVTTGTLTVTTNPAGAVIAVDGEARGTTPVTLTLAAGPHQIVVQGAGDPRTLPVTITAGAESVQYIEMPAARSTGGQLQVKTEPSGAQVTIDGVAHGVSPITVGDLAPGEHAVVLAGPNGSSRQTVTIERGATASLVVSLASTVNTSQPGWIAVQTPVAVQIFENGRLLGTSATDQIMVSAGRHDIDFVNDTLGFRLSRTVQVAPGKVASVAVDLPSGTLALNAVPWAEVWIDGEKKGDTPIGNLSLTIGSHDVVFRHPELGEQHHTVVVTLKGAGRLSVDLRKK